MINIKAIIKQIQINEEREGEKEENKKHKP